MNRRAFLEAIAGAIAADPERLLWRPGAKLISIPRPQLYDERAMIRYVTLATMRDVLQFHPNCFVLNYPRIGDRDT